jgi:hypothetical protein
MVIDQHGYPTFYARCTHTMYFEDFAVMDSMRRIIRYLNQSGATRPDPVDLSKNVFHRLIKVCGLGKTRSKPPSPFEKRGW